MTRTIGGTLTSHIATGRTKLARCVRLDLVDGTSLGFSDHDQDLSVNLGDGSLVYVADDGMAPSAIAHSVGLDSDSTEIRGPIGPAVTAVMVLGGRLDRATVRVFDVKWDATANFLRLLKGKVTQSRIEAGEFVLEILGLQDAFNQTIGEVTAPQCRRDYGGPGCSAVVPTWDGIVDSVSSDLVMAVSWTGAEPSEPQARSGKISWTSGGLLGTRDVEILNYDTTVNGIIFFVPLVDFPQVGDTFTLSGGCSKLRMSSDPAEVTCLTNGVVVDFGGFPDAPGTPAYIRYPVPGMPGQ